MSGVNVLKSTVIGSVYTTFNYELFDMRNAISYDVALNPSGKIRVIDSYSSHIKTNKNLSPPAAATYSTLRYKGDPFRDLDIVFPNNSGHRYWESYDDIGRTNDWVVIESLLGGWQAKIQIQEGYGFADVSDPTGVKYPKHHGDRRVWLVRFSPLGGWNKADSNPDFVVSGVANPTGQNHWDYVGNRGSGDLNDRFVTITTDHAMFRFHQYSAGGIGWLGGYYGLADVVDGVNQPIQAIQIGSGDQGLQILSGPADRYMLCDRSFSSATAESFATSDTYGGGIVFWDHNQVMRQERFRVVSHAYCFQSGLSQPNPWGVSPELDVFPYKVIPLVTQGEWFSIPTFRLGYGVGRTMVNNGLWYSCGAGFHPLMVWDGVTII